MNPSPSVLDALEAQLGPETIQAMSAKLGTDSAATANAISMALPILLGGLSKNAATADGSASLDTALNAHDGGILDNLGGLLRGGAGTAILGHILGSRRDAVQDGVGRASGLNAQQIAQLLALLAPLVMGVLGKMKREKGIDAEQLPVVLGQANLDMARQSTAVGDLSRVFDNSQDGEIADDIARIGSSIVGGMLGRDASR